jgi:hypothetical protein
MSIAGATFVFARTDHSTTDGSCGYGELGSLKAVIVATLAAGSGPTKAFTGGWSDDTAAGLTAPNKNGTVVPIALTTASEVMATVTGSYAAAGVTGVPAAGDTHGFLFLMDDSVGGGNPVKLYTDSSSPAACAVDVDGYAKCMKILPMAPRR